MNKLNETLSDLISASPLRAIKLDEEDRAWLNDRQLSWSAERVKVESNNHIPNEREMENEVN